MKERRENLGGDARATSPTPSHRRCAACHRRPVKKKAISPYCSRCRDTIPPSVDETPPPPVWTRVEALAAASARFDVITRCSRPPPPLPPDDDQRTPFAFNVTPTRDLHQKYLNLTQALHFIESRGVPLLDLRTRRDYDLGHVRHAVSFPWDDLVDRQYELPPRDTPLLLYTYGDAELMDAQRHALEGEITREGRAPG